MRLVKDQKGVTLVEIIVAFLIFAIVAATAGTMLISSSNFFERNVISNLDKLSADEIHNFAIEKLLNATSVLVVENELSSPDPQYPHYITVKGGRFLLDGENIFTDDYYHNRNLQMQADETETQLMLNFLLFERDDTAEANPVYRTSREVDGAAIKLMNIEMAKKRPAPAGGGAGSPPAPIYGTGKIQTGLPDGSNAPDGTNDFIYFGFHDLEPVNEGAGNGTVADEQFEVTDQNFKGDFTPDSFITGGETHLFLRQGDFFTWNGQLYRVDRDTSLNSALNPDNPGSPHDHQYKKIDAAYDPKSMYINGDVVIADDGSYYMAIANTFVHEGWPPPWPGVWIQTVVDPDGTRHYDPISDSDGYWLCTDGKVRQVSTGGIVTDHPVS